MRAVAIVNRNARRVQGGLRGKLERVLPGRVRLTSSLAEVRAAIRQEVARGIELLVLAGGDGTVVMGLALVAEACRGAGRPAPAIGVLRLGSGNAIAASLGASDDAAGDLARLVRGDGTWHSLPLVEVLGVRTPVAGLGLDAQLREDHHAVGALLARVPGAGRLVGGAARVALSSVRSVAGLARSARVQAVVHNLGAPAIEMAREGATGPPRTAGQVLWRGPCTWIAGATIPSLGFGLKLFPFAGVRRDRFHLRCGDAGLLELVRHAPAARRGAYFSEHVRDFLCERVAIELDAEAAIQAGGELLGRHRRVELALAAPASFVALAPAAR